MSVHPKTILTGIKPTGSPHIGNYLGAIQPAIQMAHDPSLRAYLFIADFHALTSATPPKEFSRQVYDVAATWLASGLDPEKVVIYRQSDIPEIFQLAWILSCVTPKGMMNRAHAYKASVAANEEKGSSDLDAGVNMGLYGYPVLMAADILLFQADIVPVGKDQVQHVEFARDIAGRFNQRFGEVLRLPEHRIEKELDTVPGLDGQKMSKSYNNTIPIFAPQKKLQKLINKMKTDSTPPEAPKDPASSDIFTLYQRFARPEQIENLRKRYAQGISWGEAKAELFQVIDHHVQDKRAQYEELMSHPERVEEILRAGAKKARAVAVPFYHRIEEAIGSRRNLTKD